MHYFDLGVLSSSIQSKTLSLGYSTVVTPQKIAVETQADLKKLPSKGIAIVSSKSGEVLKKVCSREPAAVLLIDAFSVPNFFKDDGLIRSVALEASAGKKVAFAVPYAYILRNSFVYRARFVAQAKLFLAKCLKRGAPFVLVSGAENEFELKSPREALALAGLLGLSFEQAQKGLGRTPEKLVAEENKK